MGILASQSANARCCVEPCCTADPQTTQKGLRAGRIGRHVASLTALIWPVVANAETLRIAVFSAPLSRDGPGLLYADLLDTTPNIAAIIGVIAEVSPDILVLTDFDTDYDQHALNAFSALLETHSAAFGFSFAPPPITGVFTGVDYDQDGRLGEPEDAQGYGRFIGNGSLVLLSKCPITVEGTINLSTSESSKGHWIVPLNCSGSTIAILMSGATPPVFDGPEDRNGLRNRAELEIWTSALDREPSLEQRPFVFALNANLDPFDGEGFNADIAAFLADPRISDPLQSSSGARDVADISHRGPAEHDTVDWPDGRPGNLRVSYVLPSAELQVIESGVFWPSTTDPLRDLIGEDGLRAGPHRLVWVDVQLQRDLNSAE